MIHFDGTWPAPRGDCSITVRLASAEVRGGTQIVRSNRNDNRGLDCYRWDDGGHSQCRLLTNEEAKLLLILMSGSAAEE